MSTLLYFTRKGAVGVAGRRVSVDRPAIEAVQQLVLGTTPRERSAGLGTAIPGGTRARGVTIGPDRVATVDLSERFGSAGSDASLRLRVAQVVCTLTHFPTVERVRILLGGKPVAKLGPVSLASPLSRNDVERSMPAILVEAPVPYASVGSPLRVTGSANVFEAQFVAELYAPSGKRLARQSVRATSGTGTRGAFSAELRFSTAAHGKGFVVVYEPSAKDGSPINVVRIPVTF